MGWSCSGVPNCSGGVVLPLGWTQHRSSQCTIQMCSIHHAVGLVPCSQDTGERTHVGICTTWPKVSKCGMEGCSWEVWQCHLGTCSLTVPPVPSLAAGSGDRAHPAFQQDHPPHARLCNSAPPQQSPELFIFTALSCVHEPHRETHTAPPECSHPCVCMHQHAQAHINMCAHRHAPKCPQNRTRAHRQAYRNICTPLHVHTQISPGKHTALLADSTCVR